MPDNIWLLAADGKPRSTFAFTPFFGGKRICLGKTFAEVTIRFTIPLIYYHVDFEKLVDHEYKKELYSVGGSREIKLPMKVRILNPVK